MWILSPNEEGNHKRILINIETGVEIRLSKSEQGEGGSIVRVNEAYLVTGHSQSIGRYTTFDEASEIFKKIVEKLAPLNAGSSELDI